MKTQLVYPIYLDTPMMTAFLASIEGGITEEAQIETKSSDAKARELSAGGKLGLSGLLSNILNAEIESGLSRKVAETLDSNFRTTIKFPTASLFIRLRNSLLQNGDIKRIATKNAYSEIAIGDLVEFQGV